MAKMAGGFPRWRLTGAAPYKTEASLWKSNSQHFYIFLRRHPGSKNLANWQTHFFSGRSSHCRRWLRTKLSLPTVANSLANWQTQ